MDNGYGKKRPIYCHTLNHIIETIMLTIAVFSGAALISYLVSPPENLYIIYIPGVIFIISLFMSIRFWFDPDKVRAKQSETMLSLASQTLRAMDNGLNYESAQEVCEMLLLATETTAVAITDVECILGYAGADKDLNRTGSQINTKATHDAIADGELRLIYNGQDIGFPEDCKSIDAAIIVPLKASGQVIGTLKFYFRSPSKLTETQVSIASGFGELLSTQIAASMLEEQKKLATSMELKALQSQINPHFLFNTINTISSFIRTDPAKARTLLREFAAFYRRALEDSMDLISLYREVDQTSRYLYFEIARFGEERLQLTTDVPEEFSDLAVPAFMIQPLVENAVKHAMPPTGCLHITITARRENEDDLAIDVADDGVGMSEERRATIKDAHSSTGLGIAVRNINDRMHGYYGPESHMHVESEEGVGTTVTLLLKHGCVPRPHAENKETNQAPTTMSVSDRLPKPRTWIS